MTTVMRIENLQKIYGKRVVVDDLSCCVEGGDIWGLIGPNGCGKTTAIRMILNLISMTKGKVDICGYDIGKDYSKAISNVGVTSEASYLYDYLSGYDNLKLVWDICRVNKHSIQYLLNLVGLENDASVKVKKYSLGMRQRLGLAMALLNKPRLVVMDEPTNGIDPRGKRDFFSLIKKLSKDENTAFFMASHSLYDMEKVCNNVILLNKGKTVEQGYTNQILDKYGMSLEDIYIKLT